MKKRIIIFGNGRLYQYFFGELQKGDYIIGVDKAAYWLLTHGVRPDVAIGDFDSTTPREMQRIIKSIRTIKRYQPEKNWTDMELAIKHAISVKPSEVIIFGGTGTRQDHTLSALYIMNQLLASCIPHAFVDAKNRIRLIGRGETIVEKASYRYISLLPCTKSITVSLTGFRYDLSITTLAQGTSIGVSNELRAHRGVIRLFSGRAWVIESND